MLVETDVLKKMHRRIIKGFLDVVVLTELKKGT